MNFDIPICAILPRGEAIRNFVYSGALDRVAQRTPVSLLTVSPNTKIFKTLTDSFSDVQELVGYPERWIVRSVRELLDMAHGKWLWSEAAKERWRLRDLEATTCPHKLERQLKKFACYPFSNRFGLRLLSWLERMSSRIFRTTNDYRDYYLSKKPSLVFNGSHVHSRVALQAVQAAQWLDIPTATFIFSWDNLTSQGRVIPPYDYYLVWNNSIRDQLLEIYDFIKPDQVLVTGTPQFDFHFDEKHYWSREEYCTQIGADPSRPIVLYTTGMSNHMPGEPDIVEGIADLLTRMNDFGSPQLVVRVYPKDITGRFNALKERRTDITFPSIPWEPNWLTPYPEDIPLWTNMLKHADIGINVASTVSLELMMFSKPVINVGYNPSGVDPRILSYNRYYTFDHYRPIVDSGAVLVASDLEELQAMVQQALTNGNIQKESQMELLRRMFGDTLDGCSGERVAKALLKLASLPRR